MDYIAHVICMGKAKAALFRKRRGYLVKNVSMWYNSEADFIRNMREVKS